VKIKIIAVGKLKQPYINSGVKDYLERLKHYIPIEILEVSEKDIPKYLSSDNFSTVLNRIGKEMSSPEFAEFINKLLIKGNKDIYFFIGGAEGFDEEFIQKGDFVLSMSSFTFPHELARLILLEQLYRAFTIIRNEKYHK
jgi:23S rRNA (pseudouridine1915-N3)-methyltransferase